jgi:cation transport ATPase
VLEPTNLLLLACALIYGLIGEPQEAAILLVFVAGISLLDAWQQRRSRRALAELARLSAPLAHVRRDGVELDSEVRLAVSISAKKALLRCDPPMHGHPVTTPSRRR